MKQKNTVSYLVLPLVLGGFFSTTQAQEAPVINMDDISAQIEAEVNQIEQEINLDDLLPAPEITPTQAEEKLPQPEVTPDPKEEADLKAQEEAAAKAKAEADRKAKKAAEAKARAEQEKKAKEEAAAKAKAEAERKAKEEAEQKKKEEEAKMKAELEKLEKEKAAEEKKKKEAEEAAKKAEEEKKKAAEAKKAEEAAKTAPDSIEVPYGTTLEQVKKAITPASQATFGIYEEDEKTLASSLEFGNTYKIVVTAGDKTTTKSYTLSVASNTDTKLSSTLGTVNTEKETLEEVPYGTTVEDLKAALSTADQASFEIFEADGKTVASELVFGQTYKITVTAGDKKSTADYTFSLEANTEATIKFSLGSLFGE